MRAQLFVRQWMLCVVTVLFRRSMAFQNAFNATGTKFANSLFDDVGTDQSLSYYLNRFPRLPIRISHSTVERG